MPTSDMARQAMEDVIAGSAGGVLAALVGHPFDTIKVRLQTQPALAPIYGGFNDCVRQTWSVEGPVGFYRGLTSPLAGMLVFNAVQFMAYGQARDWVQARKQTDLDLTDYITCGAWTGVAVSAVESPMDLVKSQVQVQIFRRETDQVAGRPLHFRSAVDAAIQIWNMNGVRGIYQGLGATLIRNVPAVALYFGAYEQTRRSLAGPDRSVTDLSSVELLCSGGVAGLCYWLFTYPADIIKSTMQTDHVLREHRKYGSVWSCIRGLYADGGLPRFFRGLTPCMLRAFPANAACFWGVEQTRKLFQ